MKNGAATNACATTTPSVVNGSVMPSTPSAWPASPVPAERREQRDAGHRRRQHHREVDQRLEQRLATELAHREQVRHRQAERHHE